MQKLQRRGRLVDQHSECHQAFEPNNIFKFPNDITHCINMEIREKRKKKAYVFDAETEVTKSVTDTTDIPSSVVK